jgi:hypothetical protein
MGIEGWRRKVQDREQWGANSTGGQGSCRAVAPSGDDDGGGGGGGDDDDDVFKL